MPDEQAVVEIVAAEGESKVPMGIVSVKQALDMPAAEGIEYSHQDHEAGPTDVFVNQKELAKLP